MVQTETALLLIGIGVFAIATVLAVLAYVAHRIHQSIPTPLEREKLTAYHDIVSAMIKLNRKAVALEAEDQFVLEQERYVMNNDSELDELIADATESFHKSYYLIDSDVRNELNDYLDYFATYHAETGPEIGEVLQLSGSIVETIRSDIDLDSVFGGDRSDEDHGLDVLDDENSEKATPES